MNPESFQTESYKDATTDPDDTKTKKDKSYAKHLNMQLQNIKNTYSVKCTSKLLCAEGYFVTLSLVLQESENGFITPDLGEGVMYGIVCNMHLMHPQEDARIPNRGHLSSLFNFLKNCKSKTNPLQQMHTKALLIFHFLLQVVTTMAHADECSSGQA